MAKEDILLGKNKTINKNKTIKILDVSFLHCFPPLNVVWISPVNRFVNYKFIV